MVGSSVKEDGKIIQKYVNAKTLVKDVAFEEAHGKAVVGSNAPANPSPTGEESGNTSGNTGGSTGGNTGGDDDNPNEN